jgi:hypothetical protein
MNSKPDWGHACQHTSSGADDHVGGAGRAADAIPVSAHQPLHPLDRQVPNEYRSPNAAIRQAALRHPPRESGNQFLR